VGKSGSGGVVQASDEINVGFCGLLDGFLDRRTGLVHEQLGLRKHPRTGESWYAGFKTKEMDMNVQDRVDVLAGELKRAKPPVRRRSLSVFSLSTGGALL